MDDNDQMISPSPLASDPVEPAQAEAYRPAAPRRDASTQMIDRIRAGLSQWRLTSQLAEIGLSPSAGETVSVIPPDNWPGDATLGTELIQGILRFHAQTIQLDSPNWEPIGATPAFLTALHGFDWLRDLKALGGDVARRQARLMVRSWIEHNASWSPLPWDAPVLGQRIANWLSMYDFFCATADDDFRTLVFESLRRQARHLARTIGGTPAGYGRLTALKGLFFSGVCLPKGEARLALALRFLGPELSAQVLADGGHAERNPVTLLNALRQLIDIRNLLRAGAQEVPEKLQHAIDRMTPALRFFRHADGGLALFNGGREGDNTLIEAVLAQSDARGKPLKSMTHSGFERITAGRTAVLVDCGSPPGVGFDAQAYAGPLAFEVSVGRDRMIVNCGAHPSLLPAWRRALGATAAHSTLTMNDTNAVELTAHGMGRKPEMVACTRQEENGAIWLELGHDGYEHLFQTTVFRRIYVGTSGEDVRGEDALEGPAGHSFAIRFHLHPTVQASLIQQGQAVLLALPSGGGWRLRASGGSLSLEESIYAGRGEEPRRTQQIVITGTTSADQTIVKWALQREKRS